MLRQFVIRIFSIWLILSLVSEVSLAKVAKAEDCAPNGEAAETVPAKVDLKEVSRDIRALQDSQLRPVVGTISPELELSVRRLFTTDPKSISKLEQFYALLFYLAKYRSLSDRNISFSPKTVVDLLVSSKVFSDVKFPSHIVGVELNYDPHKELANYQVRFDVKELRLPLNQGKGFSNFREGLCQRAKELVFYGGFNFDVQLTVNHNHVFVSHFKNVDLFGDFGSRGIVDVDINYVSLRSVEFLSGSPTGIVRAKVSKKEFEINQHSMLLQLVSSLVTDRSQQAIDW